MLKRKPDLTIGPPDSPYMHRWHLWRWRGEDDPETGQKRYGQVALHRIFKSDDDRALHDHRADNISIVLSGGYLELMRRPDTALWGFWRRPGSIIFRRAETPHRIVIAHDRPVWTLWIRFPPRREWGFHCPKGWRRWQDFCDEQDYSTTGVSTVGPGCD